MFFCSVYFYLKPNEKAAGSASYASLRGGEEGDTLNTNAHSSQNVLCICCNSGEIQTPEALILGGDVWGIDISISPLFTNHKLNSGHANKRLFLPTPREKGDFNNTRPLLTAMK